MRIVVTGGSGRAGRFIIPELVRHGHQVVNTDLNCIVESEVEFLQADLAHYDQTLSVLHGADAVIHMARIKTPVPEVERPASCRCPGHPKSNHGILDQRHRGHLESNRSFAPLFPH